MTDTPTLAHRCACVSDDAFRCVRIRYQITEADEAGEGIEPCECICHDHDEDPWDDEGGWYYE